MKATHEDVMKCRDLFWQKMRGEITQEELEEETTEIAGKQTNLFQRSNEPLVLRGLKV